MVSGDGELSVWIVIAAIGGGFSIDGQLVDRELLNVGKSGGWGVFCALLLVWAVKYFVVCSAITRSVDPLHCTHICTTEAIKLGLPAHIDYGWLLYTSGPQHSMPTAGMLVEP